MSLELTGGSRRITWDAFVRRRGRGNGGAQRRGRLTQCLRGGRSPVRALQRRNAGTLPQLLDRGNDAKIRHASYSATINPFMAVERRTRPLERFWPYAEHPEEPTVEELAALDPDLHAALFGPRQLPFSVTLVFAPFAGEHYARAVDMARAAPEYREVGSGDQLRHRARFFPGDALRLRDLFDIISAERHTEVLVDDRPIPYARELWLPLIWFLLLP